MKEYKIESRAFYASVTKGREYVMEAATYDLQKIIDDYSSKDWVLVSTDSILVGFGYHFYLYFERNVS